MALALEDITVQYGARTAVASARLAFDVGSVVGLVGPNGAGKSSLLKAIAGVVPHAGRVTWDGAALRDLSSMARARVVAYLPQAAIAHWPMAARDIVALGRLPHRTFGALPAAADHAAVAHAMDVTAVTSLSERSVLELSIGERARVALARALAVEAPVLLVDEPTAMLDPHHQLAVMGVLRAYAHGTAALRARSEGTAPERAGARRLVVAVLHDLTLAARFCDRIVMLDGGAVAVDDTPERALTAAVLERRYRVAALVGSHAGEPLIVPWRPLV